MRVIQSISEMKEARKNILASVGFVPTMGYLHEGHMTLVRWSKNENDITAASIFVNPTQFGPQDDFERYPRNTERDLAMLDKEGVDIVFMPPVDELYPQGYNSWVEVKGITDKLEGISRPGHFRGVTTVVAKLFNLVQPHRAYFGQKDAQQLRVIKKMVIDLNMNVEVVSVPTVREADGLAMSSRNTYLNPAERNAALIVSKSIQLAQSLWTRGERNANKIKQQLVQMVQNEPLAKIDYISIADDDSLDEVDIINGRALVSMAVWVGKTRLIDNIVIES